MFTMSKGIALSGACALLCGLALADDFDLSWHTIDGGGVTLSTGGGFELSGTIGQSDAGVLAGGAFELTGGFWFETPPGDCDFDGITNLAEFGDFMDCTTGPTGSSDASCACFDLDGDGDVDLIDFGRFQTAFNSHD